MYINRMRDQDKRDQLGKAWKTRLASGDVANDGTRDVFTCNLSVKTICPPSRRSSPFNLRRMVNRPGLDSDEDVDEDVGVTAEEASEPAAE